MPGIALIKFYCGDHFELAGFEVEGGKTAVENIHLVF